MKAMVLNEPQVRLIDCGSDLESLRPEWNLLLEHSSADSVFLTWEWIATWWRHFGNGRRLHVIEVRRSGRLIAIAPLYAGPHGLEFLGTGSAGADYLDFILERESETEAVEILASRLENDGRRIRLRQFVRDSAAARLAARLNSKSYLMCERSVFVCPYLTLPGTSWEAFVSTLGTSHRANLRRRLRGFEARGDIEWATDEETRLRHLHTLIDLHNARWVTRGGSDAFNTPALVAFHEDFTKLALAAGWLRLFVLHVDGQDAAAVYGLSRRGKACFYQGGFAAAFESMSVGLVGLGLSIRNAIEEGASEYDLLHGDESYKALWTNNVRTLWACELYPNSVAGTLSMRLDQSLRKTRRMARYVISKVQPPRGARPDS